MIPIRNQKMVAEGVARLTDAFRNTNVAGFVKGWLASVQDLDDAAWSVIDAIQNPTGDLLERFAAIVGETRQGRSDADLLAAVKLRVLVNKSQGLAEDIIRIAIAIFPSASYREGGIASWLVEAWNLPAARTFITLLGEAKDGGARGIVHFSTWDVSLNLVAKSVHGGVTVTRTANSVHGGVASPGQVCSSEEAKKVS